MNYIHLNTFKLMIYKNIKFEKISKSEQQLQSLSLIGINYDKRLKKMLLEEYQKPSEVNDVMLNQFEEESGINFPIEYKKFLLTTNGGSPSKDTFDISPKKNRVIQNFFTLNSKVVSYTLKHNNSGELISFSKDYYAIAYTVNGDFIMLNVDDNSNNYGGVFIYFHDKENSLKKIASSFDDFLYKLHD